MLDAKLWRKQCFTCMWANKSAIEIEYKFGKVKRYRKETFCYGPRSCPLYDMGPPREVPYFDSSPSRRLTKGGWMTCVRNSAVMRIDWRIGPTQLFACRNQARVNSSRSNICEAQYGKGRNNILDELPGAMWLLCIAMKGTIRSLGVPSRRIIEMYKTLLFSILLLFVTFFVHGALAEEGPLLERIEWSDIWVVDANKDALPRILLVGDSIVRGYFDAVEKALEGTAYCARYTTSKFMGNPDYLAELEVLLNGYRFDVIHINNGLHGWAYTEGQYAASFPPLLDTLEKHGKGAAVIWATTTPVRSGRRLVQFDKKTERVKERNRIAVEVMNRHGIPVNDLYGPVEQHPEFYSKDGTHFNNEGRAAQGKQVAEAVSRCLSKRTDADDGTQQ